jgi:hypothetical protein
LSFAAFNFNFNVATLFSHNMDSLLHIASRIEAAVEDYNSIQPVTDVEEWKRKFGEEKVSDIFG